MTRKLTAGAGLDLHINNASPARYSV
jgi:hypothetical protein